MDARTATAGSTALAPPPRAAVAPARPRARPAPRPVPELSQEHGHLTLEALRAYRTALQTEEGKVSYWRRILQARLDVVRAGRRKGGTETLDPSALRPLLTGDRVGALRSALLEVLPSDDIPPLPDLAELWERQVAPDDPDELSALEEDLTAAEQQLSSYRTALHGRLADATGELIARYHADPRLCLTALPLPRSHG